MDALDRIAGPAADLLHRVDTAIGKHGAPPGHQVWPLLRWVGTLPGPAVQAIVNLRPTALPADEVRGLTDRLVDAVATVDQAGVRWEGEAGAAYAAQWEAHRRHLTDPDASLGSRLDDMGAYLDDVEGWIAESRVALALKLALVMRSAEAISLVTGADPIEVGQAAATIGALVLGEIEEICKAGEMLHEEWTSRLAPLPFRSPTDFGPATGTHTHVDL
ncbi:hypothetical protein [Hamadaea tsunoensis]|uniref:hypothetical protein n=1 Tax=Hamadaea tsunoensis TaxID=53368 RepID=UPI00040EAEA7|nr:hypothetical protein [Hamadaea tsunoensis]